MGAHGSGSYERRMRDDFLKNNYSSGQSWGAGGTTCIKMRGLPFNSTEVDITRFFQEAGVTPVRIHRKADGAEAFVEFLNAGDADKAMTRQKAYMKNRYIELFRVSFNEVARTVGLAPEMPQRYA